MAARLRFVRSPRGVSLVEALVALAVMAFGMLAVAGIQGMLRLNSDVAKQRSEAVRIAQEQIEDWRAFAVRTADAGLPAGTRAWDAIATSAGSTLAGATTNTTYTVARTVFEETPGHKSLRVTVSWPDRTGGVQTIELSTVIAAAEPAIAGTLGMVPVAPQGLRPLGRNPGIPLIAIDLGNGKSAFTPPGAGVTWVLNNITGEITGECVGDALALTEGLNSDTLDDACLSNRIGKLLTGYVRFFSADTPIGNQEAAEAEAENPGGTALNLNIIIEPLTPSPALTHFCFDDAPATAAQATVRTSVVYYCAIFGSEPFNWSGIANVEPVAFLSETVPPTPLPPVWDIRVMTGKYRICRYTTLTSDTGPNRQHPRAYVSVTEPILAGQNFLVVPFPHDCPSDTPADPLATPPDFFNSNTRRHQPWPEPSPG